MADRTTGELPAVRVGDLPLAPDIYDDFLMPGEYQGDAVHITGAQWKEYAKTAVQEYASGAKASANAAEKSAADAAKSAARAEAGAAKADSEADRAERARQAIENLTVTAKTLQSGEAATVTKTQLEGFVNLLFGIPRGEQGLRGEKGDTGESIAGIELVEGAHAPGTTDTYKVVMSGGKEYLFYVTNGRDGKDGERGETGPQGEPGRDAVVLEADGEIAFDIHRDGHLWLHYAGSTPPDYSINDAGHLIYTLPEEVA